MSCGSTKSNSFFSVTWVLRSDVSHLTEKDLWLKRLWLAKSLTDISQMYNLVVHGVCVIWVNIYMRHSDPAKITFLSTDSFISRNAVILWGLSPQKGPCRKGWPVISVAHTQQLHYSHNKCSKFHWLQWKHCVVAAASCLFHMYVERAT